MRKQTKVLAAAALFTLGASFSAFAAKTGTWQLEEDGWYCYDADGEAYTEEFCLSAGKEFYMGEDGLMVTSDWVEYDDNYYYVGSDGSKTVNDWRYVTPFDDEDADEEWFYFGSKGKMETGKEVIGGKTYYFDNDGIMLTGWVEYDADTKVADEADSYSDGLTYCDENGARVVANWVETWEPGTDEDDQDDADLYWYYIKSAGGVQTGKAKSIGGYTYFFDNEGKMLTGWVLGSDSNADGKIDSFATFEGDASTIDQDNEAIYFCGNSDQGQVKKSRWIKTWMPADYAEEDDDNDQYWYYLGKTGELYLPEDASSANSVTFVDGDTALFTTGTADLGAAFKEISSKTYAFKNDGRMWSGLANIEGVRYYFGGSNDGEMKTGAVMIADEDSQEYKFYFGKNDKYDYTEGAAVTGAAEKYLYDGGLLVTASDDKYEEVEVGGESYIINANGAIQTSAKIYKEDGEELIDAEDWTFYTETADGTKKGAVKEK